MKNNIIALLITVCAACFCSCNHQVKTLTFAIGSDFHARDVPDGEQRLTSFIQAANDANVDFIIELGDFCRFDSVDQVFHNIWNSFPRDKYHVIGNHDMDAYTPDEYVAGMKMPGRYYSFDKGDFHFIVLDGNNLYDGENFTHYAHANFYVDYKKRAYLDPEQMQWLKADLQSTNKKCVLFSHQSIDTFMNNGREVHELLVAENKRAGFKKVVLAFSGHNHSNYTKRIDDITYMQINSASYVWIGSPTQTEKRYPEAVNKRYSILEYSMTYTKPLYAIVKLTANGADIKGTKADFVPPTPADLNMPDSIEGFPLVSTIEDATIKF